MSNSGRGIVPGPAQPVHILLCMGDAALESEKREGLTFTIVL